MIESKQRVSSKQEPGLIVNGMNMLSIATYWQAFAMGAIVILAVMTDVLLGRRRSP